MANRAYLGVWTRDFSEQTMIAEFARFLTTVPLAATRTGFDRLVVQAIDGTETPLEEWDLRDQKYGPAEIAALAIQHLNADTAYFVSGQWDLWTFDLDSLKWQLSPQPLELVCHGVIYDNSISATNGHFTADLSFEHIFTGHGGLLAPGLATNPFDTSDHPFEKTFRNWMSSSENLKLYHQKTRENIQKLFAWVESIEAALSVGRSELWSEGEQNFEARLDVILSQR